MTTPAAAAACGAFRPRCSKRRELRETAISTEMLRERKQLFYALLRTWPRDYARPVIPFVSVIPFCLSRNDARPVLPICLSRNSAGQVLLDAGGELHVVRRRQSVEQISENEMGLPDGVA